MYQSPPPGPPTPADDPSEWRPAGAELGFLGAALIVALGYCAWSWLGFGSLLLEDWALGCGVAWPLVLLVVGPTAILGCGALALAAALRAGADPARMRRLYTVSSTLFWMLLSAGPLLSCGALSAIGQRTAPC
ncbi:MAG: hypothetical protein H0T53_15320 [Herpetosiphonaceae bacterium]|nr:hypothetical protein [Herpetosiphonaceae bacterium]